MRRGNNEYFVNAQCPIPNALWRTVRNRAPDLPSSRADLELTVLMPCLNEARTLGSCVRKAQDFSWNKVVEGIEHLVERVRR